MASSGSNPTAEDLAEQQQQISVAEFFEQNRQMLGFGSQARSLVTAVKEGVDNSLDACEDAGILPHISVTITETEEGHYALTITDNGPGITKDQVPKVFGKLLYGSRFAKRIQRRGQQGIGISAAVMYGQQTTGKPAEITSLTNSKEKAEHFRVGIDTDENEPEIRSSQTVDWPHGHESGTSITIYLDATFRARSSLHKYIKHTAIVNPHATIELTEPKHEFQYNRTVDTLPEKPEEIKPHPHGIEFGTLRSLLEVTDSHSISGFLQAEFTRVGQTTAEEIIDAFRDRYDGRYCTWETPTPDEDLPIDAIENQTSYPTVTEFLTETQDDNADGNDQKKSQKESSQVEDEQPDTITFTEYVASHVNRKDPDATDAFASTIVSRITDLPSVSWPTIKNIVEEVAEDIENDYDETFGETVREKTMQSVWDVVRTSREKTLYGIIETATSDRKTESDIVGFTRSLADNLMSASDGTDSFTLNQLEDIIEATADESDEMIENPFGDTAQENVFNVLWSRMDRSEKSPPLVRVVEKDRELADTLHEAMQSVDVIAPPSRCLSPIGEDALVKGLQKAYNADFYAATSRDASSHSGEPFLVEAGIAHGGDIEEDGQVDLLRFANRVPLVYQQGACCITSVTTGIRWNNYKLSDKGSGLPQGPVAITVHVASTNVPFTSESKDAVASVEVIEEEIERAVRDVARDLKRHLKKQRSLQKRREKQDTIADVLPEFSKKISSIAGKDTLPVNKSLARIMNNTVVSVGPGEEEDKTEITAANYDNNSSHTLTIKLRTNSKPAIGQSLNIVLNQDEDGWVITWEPTVDVDKQSSITLNISTDEITSVSVSGLPDEKITKVIQE